MSPIVPCIVFDDLVRDTKNGLRRSGRHGQLTALYPLFCALRRREKADRKKTDAKHEPPVAGYITLQSIFALELILSNKNTCAHVACAAQTLMRRQRLFLTTIISDSPLFNTWPRGVSEAKDLLDKLEDLGYVSKHRCWTWDGARVVAQRLLEYEGLPVVSERGMVDLVALVWNDELLSGDKTVAYFESHISPRCMACRGEAPNEFCCPISQEVMVDPVVASDGHSYERRQLEQWFRVRGRMISPLTNSPISGQLVPNITLRKAIEEWEDKQVSFVCKPPPGPRPPPR